MQTPRPEPSRSGDGRVRDAAVVNPAPDDNGRQGRCRQIEARGSRGVSSAAMNLARAGTAAPRAPPSATSLTSDRDGRAADTEPERGGGSRAAGAAAENPATAGTTASQTPSSGTQPSQTERERPLTVWTQGTAAPRAPPLTT